MKKGLCALLAALFLLSATACSVPDDNGTVSKPDGTTESTRQTEEISTTQGSQDKEEKLSKMQFPKLSMFCMVPEKCTRKSNGSVVATTDNKAYLATIYTGNQGSFEGELAGILTASAEKYASNVNKYLGANIEASALKAKTTEKVTVSGYEAVKFSGQIQNVEGGTYQIYGYSMIIEERPVMFLGILVSEDQSSADLSGMKALIDQMAGSIFK